MRHISFSLTERQFLDGTKTVTRRLAWLFLKAGDRLLAIRRTRGLRRGEHPVVLGEIEVVQVTREHLNSILSAEKADKAEVVREGFPEMSPTEFVHFFSGYMRCPFDQMVTRIEFRRVG